jgi:endoglucanase
MGCDRRALLLAIGPAIMAGCGRARQAISTHAGSVNWENFKSAFLDPSGRVVDNGNGSISHSEGQGFGLAMALWAGDRPAFDSILRWTETTLARDDVALFSWRYDPRNAVPVADRNNATDADIFIAWALAGAARRWGDPRYSIRSAAIRTAIRQHLVLARYGRNLLMPAMDGFVTPTAVTLNPSYFVWPALDAFRKLDGRDIWDLVISDGEAIVQTARFGQYGLPTDWVAITAHDDVKPVVDRPPRFGFDAIRVPLYAMAGRRPGLAASARNFWNSNFTQGHLPPAWINTQTGERAPYGMSQGGLAIADRLLGLPAPAALAGDYYAAALQMLAAGML